MDVKETGRKRQQKDVPSEKNVQKEHPEKKEWMKNIENKKQSCQIHPGISQKKKWIPRITKEAPAIRHMVYNRKISVKKLFYLL